MNQTPEIINCTFIFKCPQQWERLQLTLDPKERFCPLCRKSVRLIESQAELERFAHQPQCVAIPHAVETEAENCGAFEYAVGAIVVTPQEQAEIEDAHTWQLWLEPVSQLTIQQMKYLREILGHVGNHHQPFNLLQIKKQFCDGNRHLLLDDVWAGDFWEMSGRLIELQIPHTFC